jgi:spore germination protein GerM
MAAKGTKRNQEWILFLLMGLIIIGLIVSAYFLFVRKVLPEISAHKRDNPLLVVQERENQEEELDASEFIPEDEATSIRLYFGMKSEDGLQVEMRRVRKLNMLTAQAKQIVENILQGPRKSENYRILPEKLELRGLFFESGTFIVDLSKEFEEVAKLGAIEEALGVYSIVNALTELDARARVKFLINGTEPQMDRGHLDLSVNLSRAAVLIR